MENKKTDLEISSKIYSFGEIQFIREPTLDDYVHPCTVADIHQLIEKLPAKDFMGICFIVFHQPTRKTDAKSPRWAAYYPEYSRGKKVGSAIFLEAIRPLTPTKWPTSLEPDDQKELEYLQAEGHEITYAKKEILISMDVNSVRRTQLQRSFIHELGHHIDYRRDSEGFSKKNKGQKEAFANKYFFDMQKRLGRSS